MPDSVKKPILFVIGAPKSGTTALCQYLAEHPEICFSEPKEPKFFHSDFSWEHRLCSTEEQYLRCFKPHRSTSQILAEGTVWYLYSKVAVDRILAFNPAARFVVALRNPIDLSYSLHKQLLYGGDEDVPDFSRAWQLQAAREKGQSLPPYCRDRKSLQYGKIARLGAQVQSLLRKVPRVRVLFLVFDDFVRNPGQAYREVLEFVGLSDSARREFPRVNENRVLRPGPLPKLLFFAVAAKRRLGFRHSFGIWEKLQPLLAETKKRPPLQDSLLKDLRDYFAADILLLSRLIKRDLSHWCRPNSTQLKENTDHLAPEGAP